MQLLTKNKLKNKTIDVADINDYLFLTAAVIGPLATINAKTSRQMKDSSGFLAYLKTTLNSLPKTKTIPFIITDQNGKITHTKGISMLVLNGNIRLFLGLPLSKKTDYHQHQLVAATIPKPNFDLIIQGISDIVQNHSLDTILNTCASPQLTIESKNSVSVMAGDKIFTTKTLNIVNHPKSLSILTPKT